MIRAGGFIAVIVKQKRMVHMTFFLLRRKILFCDVIVRNFTQIRLKMERDHLQDFILPKRTKRILRNFNFQYDILNNCAIIKRGYQRGTKQTK